MAHTHFRWGEIDLFMDYDEAEEHKWDIHKIFDSVTRGLAGTNFDGLDFCDVSAGGIQVRMFHKKIRSYCFANQHTIKHDWSNIDQVIKDCIDDFTAHDTDEYIDYLKGFIADGEKYGWD